MRMMYAFFFLITQTEGAARLRPLELKRHPGPPSYLSRRAAVVHAAAAATAAAIPGSAHAGDLAVATFSAGDPRFLQPTFDELRYLGIKRSEVGKVGATPAIRVTYDPGKVAYQRVVGAFWRSCDPTAAAQFGDQGPTIIWVSSDEEKKIAEESKRRLQLSTEFRSPTFGPMFQGRPILTEIRPLAAEWEPGLEEDQDWYRNSEKAYEKARQKTGREKWFKDAYKPVTVTACEKNKGEGAVCGFVYFPCSEENGCTPVINGQF